MLLVHDPADLLQRHAAEPARAPWWAVGVSGAAHVLLIILVALVAFTRPAALPPPPVPVEMITEAEFAAFTARPEVARVPETLPEPAAAAPPPPVVAMTNATVFYAGQALLDPVNRDARAALPTLERTDRIIQLCAIEALEQIHAVRPDTAPDAVAPYAFAAVDVAGNTLAAPAGAFRSDGEWFAISLTCTVAADYRRVTEFRFAIGDPIPEVQWAAHNLAPGRDGGPEE